MCAAMGPLEASQHCDRDATSGASLSQRCEPITLWRNPPAAALLAHHLASSAVETSP
jgi:hypothetical protein